MRQPADVLETAQRRYDTSWRDWLAQPRNELVLSLQRPSAAQLVAAFATVDVWAREWIEWSAQHSGTTLRYATVRTSSGEQRIPSHLVLEGPDAVANAVGDSLRWRTVHERYDRLRSAGWDDQALRPHMPRIRDLANPDFDLVLDVVEWFRQHPNSGLTMRQIPVAGMHTKWLERHRGLVIPLVSGRDPVDGDAPELSPSDMDALGLRRLPPQIDIILTDTRDRAAVGGLRHLRAPIEEMAQLPLRPRYVVVIENRESALPVPDTADLVVVHSLGNHTGSLARLPWISSAHAAYWGDLDRAGFTLLSRARTAIPHIESLLMSVDAVADFARFGVDDPSRADAPEPNLTVAEQAGLDLLQDRNPALRIEQERIPWSAAEMALTTWLDSHRSQ